MSEKESKIPPFARVERTGLGYFEVVAGEKRLAEFNSFSLLDEDVARAEALANKFCERVNLSFHARCAPLVEALKALLDVCPCRNRCKPTDLRCASNLARKALEAFNGK